MANVKSGQSIRDGILFFPLRTPLDDRFQGRPRAELGIEQDQKLKVEKRFFGGFFRLISVFDVYFFCCFGWIGDGTRIPESLFFLTKSTRLYQNMAIFSAIFLWIFP